MTLSINLPADAEARLRQQAAAAGKGVSEFVQEAIEEKLGLAERPSDSQRRAEQLAKFREWVAGHANQTAIADDSRDAIYGDERD